MGFIASKIEVKEGKSKVIDNAELPQDLLLDKSELRVLLKMIKNSSFEGKDIEFSTLNNHKYLKFGENIKTAVSERIKKSEIKHKQLYLMKINHP